MPWRCFCNHLVPIIFWFILLNIFWLTFEKIDLLIWNEIQRIITLRLLLRAFWWRFFYVTIFENRKNWFVLNNIWSYWFDSLRLSWYRWHIWSFNNVAYIKVVSFCKKFSILFSTSEITLWNLAYSKLWPHPAITCTPLSVNILWTLFSHYWFFILSKDICPPSCFTCLSMSCSWAWNNLTIIRAFIS